MSSERRKEEEGNEGIRGLTDICKASNHKGSQIL